MFSAIRAIWSASVPELTPTQCFAPQNFANAASSSLTSGPRTNWQCSSTVSSRRRRSAAIRACCALRSRNGMERRGESGMQPQSWQSDPGISGPGEKSGANFPGGAIGIVFELGDQPAEKRQGQLGLATATGAADLLDRASHNGRIGGARRCHQQSGVAGGDRRFLAVEQFLEQLLAGTEAGEANVDVLFGLQAGEPDHWPREINHLPRFPHVED